MRFLILTMLLMSFSLQAEDYDPHFEMRVSWIKSLKSLLAEIEVKEKNLVVKEKHFFERFKLINEAWADSRYNCFYGGWPSTLIQSGKKKLCQNPSKANSSYNASSCKENELQCQPLLFGKGLCVSFATQAERNKTYANCEDKFQTEHKGSYDFLKQPTRKEIEDLRELSVLAAEICSKKQSGICKKLMDKLPDGLKALDQGHTEAVAEVRPVSTPVVARTLDPAPESKECADPTHEHEKLAESFERVTNKTLDEMYDSMKAEFQSSPFCDPLKVINDPTSRPSGPYLYKLYADLRKMDFLNMQSGAKDSFYQDMEDKYNLSPSLKNDVLPILNSMRPGTDDQRRKLVAQAKGLILQDYLKNYRPDASVAQEVKAELLKNKIFTENGKGEIECPFVTKDAFMKAMAGREKVLKAHGGSIKHKDQLTIVDYSRPSNERRMFVMDLKSNKVLHNTWVAHGGGGNNAAGKDGFGSSPDMSNVKGSNKSSDGFIIATQKSEGKLFGPNVLLRGIDSDNSNLAARQVIIHGWGSPMASYSAGTQDYDFETEKYGPVYDALEKVKSTDFKNMPTKDMERAINSMSSTISVAKNLGATEGCLGVPVINVKHLDRKGRDKTQIELLRDDLPGSVIFNYSGSDMKSKYF